MAASLEEDGQGTVAGRLKAFGVKGVLIQMAKNGQLELKCEMPTCYCPNGRRCFDAWPDPRYGPGPEWSPNADHYPTSKRDRGELRPWNVRLAHVSCNNSDFGWRTRIHAMLVKDPTLSFEKVAEALNGKKSVPGPPGGKPWTAKRVRKAYVS
jgi:hypothetical protein